MVAGFRETLRSKALAIGRPLSDVELDAFETHFRMMRTWSRRMNLTGLRDVDAIVRRHFLEPIAAADLVATPGRLIDIGSGNGFPAVPLAILRPGIELVLVESSEKKSAFLWAVLRELGMKTARVVTRRISRASDLSDLFPGRTLTCRAVRIDDLFRDAGPLLEPGGRALLFVTRDQAAALEAHPPAALAFAGTRSLPSDPRGVVAILEPRPA